MRADGVDPALLDSLGGGGGGGGGSGKVSAGGGNQSSDPRLKKYEMMLKVGVS